MVAGATEIKEHPMKPPPYIPHGFHWLGDIERADVAGCEADKRGCVMYFDSQGQCIEFMNWFTKLSETDPTPAQ